ncbi:diaminopimelate epimerase [Alteromonadaceae bacterium 2753L.S.0a.02]|nr:diaminopimelate epimerase [Alteromonadaceae bacterium 2753L.S.0a.02]
MRVRFTKMQGIGNDFVMIDAISQKVAITPERARKLADRHFGVGCDQVLVVEAPQSAEADFRYRIFNNDGSEVENCGNGARCFAVFVRQRQLTGKQVITVETAKGLLTLHVVGDDQVIVDMGMPEFEPDQIPFNAEHEQLEYQLNLQHQTLTIGVVSMGNPHAVTIVENLEDYPVTSVGPEVEHHTRFPQRVNAGFMEIINRSEINLRVFERGVGETLACGTGACAAVASGIQRGLLENSVTVHLPGGDLAITWEGGANPVMMTGPAKAVFHGQVKI